jgi:transposase
MASLRRIRVRGYTYWQIVESRRVNGKPRPVVVAHLGKADDLLARLRGAEALRLRSHSHGAVAAIRGLAQELDMAGTIDRHLQAAGRRDRSLPAYVADPGRTPIRHDGLSVGQSLELVAIMRPCHATSKRGFAEWAGTTTLGELASVDVTRLDSQHFWDQMDQLPIELLGSIEKEIVARAIERFDLPLDTVLYDATNFFTFIASTNQRCKLPARGHNKQKRHDLRQLGVALLCTRRDGVPLLHQMYGGQVADANSFQDLLPQVQQRLIDLGRELDDITIVYDKGNVSRVNQQLVDAAKIHYVASLTTSSQRSLIAEANEKLEPVALDDEQAVRAFRTRRTVWGVERTCVVLVSETLRAGQLRGVLQHLASAKRWLGQLATTLERGKQRRTRAVLERDIQKRLMGRQHLSAILPWKLTGTGRRLNLTYEVAEGALETLQRDHLGRLVLVTDRDDWSTAEIIRAYRGQSAVEAVFAHLKDPVHVMLRPQFHWTDQKLHVHVFTCVLGYLLARLLHLRAQRAGYRHGMEHLLDTLADVKRVTVVRTTSPRSLRVASQLEDVAPELATLIETLGVSV